ncbi:MAG TPA: hypothetical protein VIL72_15070 [Beijerinckiaceae bacterium]|jgi:uncharacterized membrane protein YkoI
MLRRMTMAFLFSLALQAAAPHGLAQAQQTGCFSPGEARAVIARHRLVDPMSALRNAARQGQAEPLRSRLCRWSDKFVYEMALLRRDGKVIRVYLNAADGAQIGR